MILLRDFQIKDIIISEDYKNTVPGENKMQRAIQKYEQTGLLPTNIIINDKNVLIDGYITYLLAVLYGVEQLNVYRGYIEVVEAVHYTGSPKSYMWSVPLGLYGRIQPGNHVIVRTTQGVRRVLVKSIIRQQYLDQACRHKRVCKLCD